LCVLLTNEVYISHFHDLQFFVILLSIFNESESFFIIILIQFKRYFLVSVCGKLLGYSYVMSLEAYAKAVARWNST